MIRCALTAFTVAALVAAGPPSTQDGLIARIGDIDGFGFGAAAGLKAANGKAANAHGNNVLGNGDFLPDINQDRLLKTGSDEFDLRSADEVDNTGYTFGSGVFKTTGTSGANFTDISLSKDYRQRSAARKIQVRDNTGKGFVLGGGGPLPDPPSSNLRSSQPGFVFKFEISKEELAGQTPIFFNLIFGDYDVSPARIRITRSNGTVKILNVTAHSRAQDGKIQAATTTLAFDDVFQDGGQAWKGFIKVDFLAPREPYTAFDFVELSRIPLVEPPQQQQQQPQRRQPLMPQRGTQKGGNQGIERRQPPGR